MQVLILLGFELMQSVNWLAGTILSEKLYSDVCLPCMHNRVECSHTYTTICIHKAPFLRHPSTHTHDAFAYTEPLRRAVAGDTESQSGARAHGGVQGGGRADVQRRYLPLPVECLSGTYAGRNRAGCWARRSIPTDSIPFWFFWGGSSIIIPPPPPPPSPPVLIFSNRKNRPTPCTPGSCARPSSATCTSG